jgi:hypothetical protein
MSAAPEYTDGWARAVQVIRWLLVVVLVLDAAVGVLAQPRQSPLTDLHDDLASGKVRSIAFTSHDQMRFFRMVDGMFGSQAQDQVVMWRVGAIDYRVADLSHGSAFVQDNGSDSEQPSADQLRSQVDRAARVHRVPVTVGSGADLLQRFPQTGLAVFLLLLLVLFRAGQPRLATRWATFWLLLAPLNIGMLRVLIRESPWSPEIRAWPEPPPHKLMPDDRRLTGGGGFLQMLFCYLGVQLVIGALAALRW